MGAYFLKKQARSPILEGFGRNIYALLSFSGQQYFRKRFFEKAGCKYRPEYRQNQDTMLWVDGMKAGTRHANLKDVVLQFRFTDSLFKKRRNGWAFAKKQFNDRLMINKTLGYGMGANVFGFLMFCMLVSPPWVKKIAYKVFR